MTFHIPESILRRYTNIMVPVEQGFSVDGIEGLTMVDGIYVYRVPRVLSYTNVLDWFSVLEAATGKKVSIDRGSIRAYSVYMIIDYLGLDRSIHGNINMELSNISEQGSLMLWTILDSYGLEYDMSNYVVSYCGSLILTGIVRKNRSITDRIQKGIGNSVLNMFSREEALLILKNKDIGYTWVYDNIVKKYNDPSLIIDLGVFDGIKDIVPNPYRSRIYNLNGESIESYRVYGFPTEQVFSERLAKNILPLVVSHRCQITIQGEVVYHSLVSDKEYEGFIDVRYSKTDYVTLGELSTFGVQIHTLINAKEPIIIDLPEHKKKILLYHSAIRHYPIQIYDICIDKMGTMYASMATIYSMVTSSCPIFDKITELNLGQYVRAYGKGIELIGNEVYSIDRIVTTPLPSRSFMYYLSNHDIDPYPKMGTKEHNILFPLLPGRINSCPTVKREYDLVFRI